MNDCTISCSICSLLSIKYKYKGLLNVDFSSSVSLLQRILPLFMGLLIYLRVFKGSTLKFILHCKRVLLLPLISLYSTY